MRLLRTFSILEPTFFAVLVVYHISHHVGWGIFFNLVNPQVSGVVPSSSEAYKPC